MPAAIPPAARIVHPRTRCRGAPPISVDLQSHLLNSSVPRPRPNLVTAHAHEDREHPLRGPQLAISDSLPPHLQANLFDLPNDIGTLRPAPRPRTGVLLGQNPCNDVILRARLEIVFSIVSLVPERLPTGPTCFVLLNNGTNVSPSPTLLPVSACARIS